MKKIVAIFILILLFSWQIINSFAVQRFPKPEFENGYIYPTMQTPAPRALFFQIFDVVVLAGALALTTWYVIKKRDRDKVFWVSVFSLFYFGFYREGCVCSVGSLQNVAYGLFNVSYAVPITVLAFFLLPLLFTLFFGRTFCASVCPLGAIQDLVAFKPMSLGVRLSSVLGIIPYIYLAFSVLYAATGTDFIICRYDPFVGFFRFDATFGMFLFGTSLLITGVFIARPYCRFLCPYGVLLNWVSRFSKYHMNISPTNCIQCRLCENSCPFDAIKKPVTDKLPETRNSLVRKFLLICLIIPFFTGISAWTGSRLHETFSLVNSKVRLVKEIDELAKNPQQKESLDVTTFKSLGKPVAKLQEEVKELKQEFYLGGWFVGGFVGLVFGIILASMMISPYRTDYTPHKGNCFSCARCMNYCPVKK